MEQNQNTITISPPSFISTLNPPPCALPEPLAIPHLQASIPVSSAPDQVPTAPDHANVALLPSSSSNPTGSPPLLSMYKNRLQEYAQRLSFPLPVYKTVNEGSPHEPQFRSEVTVGGKTYTSLATFSHRKAAEQDVAKLSMECLPKTIKQETFSFVNMDTIFCKQILYEFAVKMKFPVVIYNTVQPQDGVPIFVSSLVFNGTTYTGDPGKSKKEAEQLAARAAIISLMGDSDFITLLSEIIKSKSKLNVALLKVKDSHHAGHSVVPEGGNVSVGAIQEAPMAAVSQQVSSTQEASMHKPSSAVPVHPPRHEFSVPKPETSSVAINPPIEFLPPVQQRVIAFVPPAPQQLTGLSPSLLQKRKRKKKNKASKKARVGVQ